MNTTSKLIPINNYELDQMADAYSAFVESYPSFNQTRLLDEWRETQYSRLDANKQIYLDYTGGGLYSESQLDEHMELLRTSVLGNPHSANPTSLAMTDLGVVKPEFVAISFYKMFGYPTGIGALLIRKAAFRKMERPWFAGGTVNFASVQGGGYYLAPNEAAFEDGTINYLNIPAIKTGLKHLEKVGIDTIRKRVHCLTGWLLNNLMSLEHSNGKPMVRIYGPTNTKMRGGTVTLNFYGPDERLLDYRRIEELANKEGISLRTGCFCNPGAGEIAEGLTTEDMMAGLNEGPNLSLPHFVQVIQHRGNKSAGAIRVSVGLATNFADVYRFMHFAAGFRDKININIGEVTFDIQSCRVIRDGS